MQLALDEQGLSYTLIIFETGVVAVATLCAADNGIKPDAILMDLNTPRSDGFQVLDALRTTFPLVPITILTSSRARADRQGAAVRGVRYMEKEADLQLFLTSVGEAVRQMVQPAKSSVS
ncbi:MAG: response regulator [Bryobacteraceae bacterium]